ncbi:MAG: phosphate acyltransferase PlsX [Candidatus Omnitrophota bacterium]|nr:phosphate acyltransferase PlsX [Candidatus Omnitrophota bacterium]
MRIAVDGMGGDYAPQVVVEGAVTAALEYGFDIVIVGERSKIEAELSKLPSVPSSISVHHASEVIDMHEPGAVSVRTKKDSSIWVATELAKEKKVDAVVSAGNTAAFVSAAMLSLKRLENVERPGIAVLVPSLKGPVLMIDVGATINPEAEHLVTFGLMGEVYAKYILKKKNPVIGLLNIGEESSKGPEFLKETHRLLELSKFNFQGNAEGRDIFAGKFDVVVCDGYTGNVVLKVAESIAGIIASFIKEELKKDPLRMLGGLLSASAFEAVKRQIDYAEYGGAPLLGVNGICIISHGRSSAKAIKNAIRVAGEFVEHQVNKHIMEAIKAF